MIRVPIAHMQIAARTHPGLLREQNEDNFAVAAFRVSDQQPIPSVFAVVADGIGGHRAGEVAAELAVETISRDVATSDASDPVEILRQAVLHANQVIVAQAEEQAGQRGMGATCVCAWVIGSRLYTASLGDSRLYWLHGNSIRQLSVDHTWVHEAVEHGLIAPEDARSHPNAHVIRRYLGSKNAPDVDFRLVLDSRESLAQSQHNQGMHLHIGDVLVLCSDGLTDLVDDEEILSTVRGAENLDEAADALVALANLRGGHDNITVVLLKMVGERPTVPVPHMQQAPKMRARSGFWQQYAPWLLLAGIGLVTLLVLLVAWMWLLGAPIVPPTPTPTPLL